MITFTRSPLGRRASTIGLDSSTRRFTVETIRSIVCMSSASLVKRASMRCRLPWRSTHTSLRAVDHDLGDRLVGQQRLEDAQAERLVDDLADEPAARGAREHRALAAEQVGDQRLQPRAPLRRSELDQLGEVDLLQQLALEVGDPAGPWRPATSPSSEGSAAPSPSMRSFRPMSEALRHRGLAVDLPAQPEVRPAGHDDGDVDPDLHRAARRPGCRTRSRRACTG